MYLPDIVFYHKNCADGMGALLACDMAFKDAGHDYKAFPIQYNEPFPVMVDQLVGKDILFVDFCPKPDYGMELAKICSSVVILDHHKTAKEDCLSYAPFDGTQDGLASVMSEVQAKARPYVHFDMSQSGACLAWRFYHPGRLVPVFLSYIEDRDIWKWKLPGSEAINAWIGSFDIDLDTYYQLFSSLGLQTGPAVNEGKAILRYRDKLVTDISEKAMSMRLQVPQIEPVEILVAFSPILHSEIGNYLAERSPSKIAIVVSTNDPLSDTFKASMRSIKPVDITPYLRALGGGGHAQAGGFTFTEDTMPLELIEEAD